MTGRQRQLDVTVGPWAREKLQALAAYLEYFNTRLKFQPWLTATLFIDGFAGAGYSKIRSKADPHPRLIDMPDEEQSELIAGSPRVALELKTPFDFYLFVEQDPVRAAELEKLPTLIVTSPCAWGMRAASSPRSSQNVSTGGSTGVSLS